jgi:hypothetical protein
MKPFVSVAATATLALLAGCASKPAVVAVAPPPPVVAPPPVAKPQGAYAGMAIPARLPDGGYDTPNRNLSDAAAIWHFRVALNVAALACRGTQGDAIVTAYNAMLTRDKAPLATAETHYAAEFKAAGGADWRADYDNAMTRLYNFFSQSPARDAFCDTAAATLSDAAFVDAASLPGFAAGRLAVLEKPFTDFYRAYDAWRASQAQAQQPIYALAATTPPAPAAAPRAAPSAALTGRPRLQLDPSVFQDDSLAH